MLACISEGRSNRSTEYITLGHSYFHHKTCELDKVRHYLSSRGLVLPNQRSVSTSILVSRRFQQLNPRSGCKAELMWSSLSFRCHFREPLGLPLFGLLHAVLTFAFDRRDTFQDPE